MFTALLENIDRPVDSSRVTLIICLTLLRPSGHYMYRTVVTICTTSLTFSNSTFCPHRIFMCGSQHKQPLFPYTTLT